MSMMTDYDIKALEKWLSRPTVKPSTWVDPSEQIVATIEIGLREQAEGEVAKLHFFYADLSSLCIRLHPDGTWNCTTGQ